MGKQLRLDVAQLTDVGRKREHNEDNMAYVIPKDTQVMAKKGALFIVADGMGGHAAGEVASEIAVDTISNVYYQDDGEDVVVSLLHAIKRANALIHQRASENMLRTGMGTTCVAAVLRGSMAYIANVGDSRAYLARSGQVKQISQDHSWVAEQVRAGLLTEEQARTHAQRNVITRSLGTQADVDIDIFTEQLEESDTLVLCTDGLSGLVSDDDIRGIVAQFVPQESVYHLVERANENGGPDNITAIVIRVLELGVEPNGRKAGREGEEAAILGMSPGSPVGLATRVGNGRIISVPLGTATGPLSEVATAPQPVLQSERKRSRLFFPTIALTILLVIALVGLGANYFLRQSNMQSVDQSIQSAQTLITRAKGEVTTSPAPALQHLARAQSILHDLQSGSLTDDQRNRVNTLLNGDLTQAVKNAITSYNQLSSIVTLPCNNTTPGTITEGSTNTHVQEIATIRDAKGTTTLRYALGQDHNLYQIDQQDKLASILTDLPKGTQITQIAGAGQRLFLLLSYGNGSTTTYSVANFLPDQKKLGKSAPISLTAAQAGQTPRLLTVSETDVYVVLSSPATTTANTEQVFDFNAVDLNPRGSSLSIQTSSSILSIAALPGRELFFLLADGSVSSFQFGGNNPAPSPVLIQGALPPTLTVTEKDFTAKQPVPTVTPVSQSGNSKVALTIPGATALVASMVDSFPHLYIVDGNVHRIVDLKLADPNALSTPRPSTPTPATTKGVPTAEPKGGVVTATPTLSSNLTFQVVRQYASSTLFAQVKSIAVNPQGFDVLSQQPNSTSFNLIPINTGPQGACA